MSAALCALYETIKQDPLPYKNLVPSFISILKQVDCCLSTPHRTQSECISASASPESIVYI